MSYHGFKIAHALQNYSMAEFVTSLIYRFKAIVTQTPATELDCVLTGIPNVDTLALAKVDNTTLNAIRRSFAYTRRLYESDALWYTKVELEFGAKIVQYKPQTMSVKDFYYSVRAASADISHTGFNRTLRRAAEDGNLVHMRIALHAGADVNRPDMCGWTALMFASARGHLEIVKELIQARAHVNTVSNERWTALMLAAQNGYFEIVKELIQAGANVRAVASHGWTALALAQDGFCVCRRTKIVELLETHAAE